jgi:hypothetical protein
MFEVAWGIVSQFIGLYLLLVAVLISFAILSLPTVKGRIGEWFVQKRLEKLDSEKYKIMNDVLLKLPDGKTSQIDHLILSEYGIFVVETKNYKGWIFGNEKSKYWTQTIYKRKEKLYNPIWQNNGHINALKEVLNGYGDLPFVSIITFSGRATFKFKSAFRTARVIYNHELTKKIKEYNHNVISTSTVDKIHKHLISLQNSDKEAKKEHVQNIKRDLSKPIRAKTTNTCPKCGNQLVERKGKYGNFMGCSAFPKCRYTLSQSS